MFVCGRGSMFSFLSLQTRHQRAKKSCQVGGRWRRGDRGSESDPSAPGIIFTCQTSRCLLFHFCLKPRASCFASSLSYIVCIPGFTFTPPFPLPTIPSIPSPPSCCQRHDTVGERNHSGVVFVTGRVCSGGADGN